MARSKNRRGREMFIARPTDRVVPVLQTLCPPHRCLAARGDEPQEHTLRQSICSLVVPGRGVLYHGAVGRGGNTLEEAPVPVSSRG